MAQAPRHRKAIVETAARLFRQQGFAATGLNQIVEESAAPKGSIYHYFPEGKEAIGAAAVAWAGERVVHTLAGLANESDGPGELLRRYAALLGGWMADSDFRDGCPIATTLLETAPRSGAIRDAGAVALAAWARVFSDALQARGAEPLRAARLAALAVASIEGALLQARVAESRQPLVDAAEELALAFEAAIRASRT
ncbi:TetR/AcrR family transcriptional regulator [Variovorax sp. J31P207]|uniref:TetR/AcrR family transcriptional regulator n=1 Tax=Variovorax sp. J31P207 TaxID=3053510 RepID=UPI0025764E43|nr:TetR/AcrR family transcriptional regulator [Variovorax sp. J31P207]MDM0071214.1 helix-turn-helix domain-containing protein [Variovorax sp. J31P207]